jgi:CheY-like chemotaxis protein
VLGNLTLNAINYTPRGRVLLRCRRRGKRLRVQVWDTGIGVARSERERIFEEFYQVANEARDRRKGLGLGLALARQLCALLEHGLTVRSIPGRGSLFSVDMPIAEPSIVHATPPRVRREPDYLRGAQVVVIDDDATCLESTAEALRQFGCRVLAASSAAQAIERLHESDFMPQLVVSDYRLAGENGMAAIAKVLANRKAAYGEEFGCAYFLVSGDTAPGELKAVQEAGYTMLHKPVRLEQLYDAANRKLSELAAGAA